MQKTRWIEFEGKTYKVKDGQTALDAMLRGGADLFFSCRRGACRSCMLEAVEGDPGEASRSRLPPELIELGFFLPCVADSPVSVVARLPDLSKWVTRAMVAEKTELSGSIYKILLETERQLEWRAGQHISIHNAHGQVRSYSIASLPEDYFLELHVRYVEGGALSEWLIKDVDVGETLEFNGPVGTCFYSDDLAQMPLVLVSTGSGGGAMLGIAREALARGHEGKICFYHGSSHEHGLYLRKSLEALEAAYPNFKAYCLASREGRKQRVVEAMLADWPNLGTTAIFLCGNPDMVEAARIGAMRNGASIDNIFADPFTSPESYIPADRQKVKTFPLNPEMWSALKNGALLTEILTAFYTLAFEDPRLAPFFHKVTKQRLIEKQYAFTRDLLTGSAAYFGELPFNSHHWMIISDELFDHREKLFFSVVRGFDLPENFVHQWAALNEMFRREIVKSSARGQMIDGEEYFKDNRTQEKITVDTLCDGCGNEIRIGETAQLHQRTGELFCQTCTEI